MKKNNKVKVPLRQYLFYNLCILKSSTDGKVEKWYPTKCKSKISPLIIAIIIFNPSKTDIESSTTNAINGKMIKTEEN